MKILTCPNCKNILLAIDGLLSINIPLPESIVQAEAKCNGRKIFYKQGRSTI